MAPDIICPTRQAWLDKLVAMSRQGLLPARQKVKGERGDYTVCSYLTEDGQQCAVGVLFPPGKVKSSNLSVAALDLFREQPELLDYLPEGVAALEAHVIQWFHDDIKEWNHDEWVKRLLACRVFAGMTPSP